MLKGQLECKFLKGRSKSTYHTCVGRGLSEKDLEIQSQSNLEINQKCRLVVKNTPWVCKIGKYVHNTNLFRCGFWENSRWIVSIVFGAAQRDRN